ncbi:fatty acyl-AMP ligase [Pseudomonas batumici]|uniref:BatY n=2 Tax=Pseudomonas TaxID=286 RepID=D4NZG0_PSEFL|nr:fatty acyl-AMP ligase [Pseudomonas batumici]ADD82966.1 BatY [Pseudomonas fluorescens]KIH86030.1 BatY, batumin synthesis operon, long-chain-fatty-acid--CoA ligase [Pseudomonas batumici]
MPDKNFYKVPNTDVGCAVKSIVEVCQWRGIYQPDNIAYRFLNNGLDDCETLTYGELLVRLQTIAGHFDVCDSGERAILLFPSGFDYISSFYACLFAGIVAVPAYPMVSHSEHVRLRVIIKDCNPRYILTTSVLKDSLLQWLEKEGLAQTTFKIIVVDELAGSKIGPRQVISQGEVAFLQYTSGSTGNPKGVIVTNQNLLHNSAVIYRKFEHDADSSVVSWLPPFHDMGLVGGIIQPLFAGFTANIMSPMTFLRRPLRWLQAISLYGATSSGGPNFSYKLCAKHFNSKQMAGIDLSSWRVAFNGAEPIRAQTLKSFFELFSPYGFSHEAFYPCYGLAESTLFVSGGSPREVHQQISIDSGQLSLGRAVHVADHSDAKTVVGSGQVLGNEVVIVDPQGRQVLNDRDIGEIWVSGESVAQGYWQRPEESEVVFQAMTQDGRGPFMRTGDYGFFDGQELFITGRLKEVIIINGKNYFPSDIESSVQALSSAFKADAGAAISIDAQGEQLVVIQEVERSQRNAHTVEALEALIREHCYTAHGIRPHDVICVDQSHIPKTTSGKIKRLQVRQDYLQGKFRSAEA